MNLQYITDGKGHKNAVQFDTLYLLTIFDKSNMENLADKEILELIKLIT